MLACSNGRQDVVKLLLDHTYPRIDLNARCNNGSTAFMRACRFGHKEVVKLLLEYSEVDTSVCVCVSQEMCDFIDLHLEAFKEQRRLTAIHQGKRRKLS